MTEIGEIPSEWKVKKLGEITIGKGEYGIGASATEYIEGKPRYLRITDIGDSCRLLFNDIKGLDDADYEKYILKEGDIVFARTGNTTGKGYVYNREHGELVYAGFLIKYSIDNNIAKHNFIKYVIQSKRYWDWVNIMSTRSGQPGINSNEYSSFIVQLPPLKEQEKIASILSTVDEQIDNVDALIEKNKELKKGLMQTLLTKGIGHKKFKKTEIGEIPEAWQNESLGDMVSFEGGTQPPKKYFSNECLDGMIRLIQIRDYKSDKFKIYVPKELCRRFCDKSDVMIGRYGPPIFQILRGLEGAYNVALIKATPINERLDREYLYYFLNNEKLFNLIDSLSQRTSGQTGIDMEVLKAYKIPIPPKKEQEKIVLILSQTDKRIENYENKKKKLEEVKKGLMQQLLTGKIRVI